MHREAVPLIRPLVRWSLPAHGALLRILRARATAGACAICVGFWTCDDVVRQTSKRSPSRGATAYGAGSRQVSLHRLFQRRTQNAPATASPAHAETRRNQ